MKVKVVITGAGGMLGQALQKQLAKKHKVTALSRETLDITKYNQVKDCLQTQRPDVVINAAAFTDVDGCELEQDKAFLVNAAGPRNIAIVCNELNASMVQISTDYVFDGKGKQPYGEFDRTEPVSVYGKSKLAGEELVKALTNKFYIVRTAWLFGEGGNNFVKTMLRLATERDSLTVVDDQIGIPTYTQDLAMAIGRLIATDYFGVYHVTNSNPCSWYDFAKEIFKQSGANTMVRAMKSTELNRPAPRPSFSVLDNRFWRLAGFPELRNYQDALRDYLNAKDK
jgi:dTDP-4-dehydrorhamnose reductase